MMKTVIEMTEISGSQPFLIHGPVKQ